MKDKILTVGHVIKLVEDTFSLKAICESLGENHYEYAKTTFKRASEIESNTPTKTEEERINNAVRILNDFMNWAIGKGFVLSTVQNAFSNFANLLFEAAGYEIPINKNMMEHLLCYALSSSMYLMYSKHKESLPNYEDWQNLSDVLAEFDIFGTDERYTEDMSAWKGSLSLLLSLVKDKKKLFAYWEEKIKLDCKKDSKIDVKTNFSKWQRGKTKPSWRFIKALLDDDLCPPKECFDEINDKIGLSIENHWKTFKHVLFFSYIITNIFDSLKRQKLITKETRYMIRNGARMYYRDFFVIRNKNNEEYSPNFEKDAKENLMFRTLFCFLDGTLGNTNLCDYLIGAYHDPSIPYLFDSSDG